MKVTVKYPSHSYDRDYEQCKAFSCPICGTKDSIYQETGIGDFYLGDHHICINCESSFTIQISTTNPYDKQIADQIRKLKDE